MKRKQTIAFIIAFVMLLSLFAACGNTSGETVTNSSGNSAAAGDGNSSAADNTQASTDENNAIPDYFENLAGGIAVTSRPYKGGNDIIEYASEVTGNYTKKTPADTIVVGGTAQITSCDPHTKVVDYPWTYNVYESLLYKNAETGELEPLLATDWVYTDDTTLELTIREGVKFHDGNTMTAEDVLFSLKRAADAPQDRARDILQNIDFENSTVDSDYHVTLKLTIPTGSLLSWLTSQATAIMSKEYVESVGSDFAYLDGDAGTGAYQLVSTVTDVSQQFVAFDDYWGGTPSVKYIEARRYSDMTAMMIDYENGALDYSYMHTLESTMSFVEGYVPDTIMSRIPSARTGHLYLCQIGDVTPFTDVRIRQALASCIDYDAIIQAVYGGPGLADKAYSGWVPGMDGYQAVGSYDYNPELAREIMSELGYSKENPCKFKAYVSSGSQRDVIMEIVQAYASEVGFEMELTVGKSAQGTEVNNSKVIPSEFQMTMGIGGAGCGDTYEIWVGMVAGNGRELGTVSSTRGIPNDEWSLAVDNASSATDLDARNEYLLEAQQIMYDEVLSIPMFSFHNIAMYRPYLKGTENTSGYLTLWSSWTIEE